MPSKKPRRIGWVLGVIIATLFLGAGAAGWFLDEPMPDDQDLLLVPPPSGENDPFRKFSANPPRELLRVYSDTPWFLDEERNDIPPAVLQFLSSLQRIELREFAKSFERDLLEHGGDPSLIDRSIEGWSLTQETIWGVVTGPFPFGDLLRKAARIECVDEEYDQAFQLMRSALAIETWQAVYHPEGNCEQLWEIQAELIRMIQRGNAQRVKRRESLQPVLDWRPPESLRRALLSHDYRRRRSEILDQPWLFVPEGTSPYRVKRHRTLRRLAEWTRRSFSETLDGKPRPSSPLARAWLDPFGDPWFEAHAEYLTWPVRSYECLEQVSDLIRGAIALEWFEEDRGSLPETVSELEHYLPTQNLDPDLIALDRDSRSLWGVHQNSGFSQFLTGGSLIGLGREVRFTAPFPEQQWPSIHLSPRAAAAEKIQREPRTAPPRSPTEEDR